MFCCDLIPKTIFILLALWNDGMTIKTSFLPWVAILILAVAGLIILHWSPVFVKRYLLYMTFICDGCVRTYAKFSVVWAAQSGSVTY